MNQTFLLMLFFFGAFHYSYAQSVDEIVIGTKHVLHSDTLQEDREYWVGLPESYDSEGADYKTYPLLIVLDGHAHFRAITGMVNYLSAGYNGNRRIPEMIVIGIKNVNRNRDFTPDKTITRRKNDFGGGDKFLFFLENELIPKLDQDYRTTGYRTLFGHSLGGLLATHAYMREKTLFHSFIAVDPSFGAWDSETMDKKIERVTDHTYERYIYFATANAGKRNIRNRDRHIRLYESLNKRCPGQFHAQIEYFENENHGSIPAIAFYKGINSIFQNYGISYRDIGTSDQLVAHFKKLSKRLSWKFSPPEALVNRVGYQKMRSKSKADIKEAIQIFKLNTENFPGSYNAFDSLGEALEASGDYQGAMTSFRKSLDLNPHNTHAEARIEKLRKKE